MAAAEPPRPAPTPAARLREGARVEEVLDLAGPGLPDGARREGGARILEDQAACPFRAFARHRLGVRALAEAGPGLTAADRGQLLHAALAYLWRDLGSQAALLADSAGDRERRVARAAKAALEAFPRNGRLTPALRELEAGRLAALMGALLEQEALRAPFTVQACEDERSIAIGELVLQARLDRVDLLADGRRVVIDYKSGQARVKQWDGERPEQPQLPLYAVTDPGHVAALAFAVLRPGEAGFAGAGDGAALLPGVDDWSGEPPGWQATLTRWRHVLGRLAREFLDGHAAVSPRHRRHTCEHCDLGPLCRVGEISGEAGDDEAGDDGGDGDARA